MNVNIAQFPQFEPFVCLFYGSSPWNQAKKVKLANLVEGDPKAPFSIGTPPRIRAGCLYIPWFTQLYP